MIYQSKSLTWWLLPSLLVLKYWLLVHQDDGYSKLPSWKRVQSTSFIFYNLFRRGFFVNEEDHEWNASDGAGPSTAAPKCRHVVQERMQKDPLYRGLFTGMMLGYLLDKQQLLGWRTIIQQGGGSMVLDLSKDFTATDLKVRCIFSKKRSINCLLAVYWSFLTENASHSCSCSASTILSVIWSCYCLRSWPYWRTVEFPCWVWIITDK